MPRDREETPRTPASRPAEPPDETEGAVPPREDEAGRSHTRRATGPDAGSGRAMPAGADEPGAGM